MSGPCGPSRPLRVRLTLAMGVVLLGVGGLILALAVLLVGVAFKATPGPPAGSQAVVEVPGRGTFLVPASELSQSLRDRAQANLLRQGALAVLVVGGAGIAVSYLVVGRALRPVAQVTATARRLATAPSDALTLDQRIALQGPDDELKDLADTFDAMLARLEATFAAQQRFVANASHELRTPLAVIRTEVDVTLADPDAPAEELRRMAGVVHEATVRADRLVDALLLLATTDQGVLGSSEPVDLLEVLAAASDAVAAEANDRGLILERHTSRAVVLGDRALLERLAANLLENAVRHNVDGGRVRVLTGSDAGRVRLVVSATGAEVAPEDADALFEAFRRGGTARTRGRGAGLGLSIVRSVARAHGGTARAVPVAGGGLEVLVDLPAAP